MLMHGETLFEELGLQTRTDSALSMGEISESPTPGDDTLREAEIKVKCNQKEINSLTLVNGHYLAIAIKLLGHTDATNIHCSFSNNENNVQ